MTALLAQGRVAWDYSLGWDHSIAEIFAEDYKLTNTPGEALQIRWLGAPPAVVSDADPGRPRRRHPRAGPSRAGPPAGPRVHTGGDGSGRTHGDPFERTHSLPAGVPGPLPRDVPAASGGACDGRREGRVRAVLRCNGKPVGGAAARRGRPATVRAARVAPGACRITLRAAGAFTSYRVTVVTNALT